MTSFARAVAALLALVIGACTFLRWTPGASALQIPLRTLISPGQASSSVGWVASLALPVLVAAGIMLVGVVLNSRGLVIAGGLVAVGIPTAWILVNAISDNRAAIPIASIQFGAYGTAAAGLMTLILAAVAIDTRTPSVR